MAERAELGFRTRELDRNARRVERATKRAENTADRLANPRGATSGGGGRGGFKGALKDFAQRDEIIGRTGTIGRLAAAGNVAGFLLAFQSIEELARNILTFAKGDKGFLDVVTGQLKFLLPSILREQIPDLLRLSGVLEDREKAMQNMADDFRRALKEPDEWGIDPATGRRVRRNPSWLRGDTGSWGAEKWRNTREFARLLEEGADGGVR